MQGFAGSLDGKHATKGVMIATSQFSPGAHEYVKNIQKKIVLIDGSMLAELMIDHDVGVNESVAYAVKKIDTDYFEEQPI